MDQHHRKHLLIASGDAQLTRLRMLSRMGLVLAGVCTLFILYYMLISPRLISPTQSPSLQRGASSYGAGATRFGGTQLYHIVFGIAASWRSWEVRKENLRRWWRASDMRGFVWMDELPLNRSQAWERSLSTHHPPLRLARSFNRSGPSPAARALGVVAEAARLGLPDVHWFVVGDEQTAFVAEDVVNVLARYDHRKLYCIGGGGGVAVSYGLARELGRVQDDCLRRNAGLDECAAELGALSPPEAGFNQVLYGGS